MKCNKRRQNLTAVFVLQTDGWHLTETTPARGKGGSGSMDVSGAFLVAPGYPGCCACSNTSFVRCGKCGNIACSRFEDTHFSCPWCGDSGTISVGVTEIRAADGV